MRSSMPIGLLSTGIALLVIGSQAPVRAQDSLSLIDSLSRVYRAATSAAPTNSGPNGTEQNGTLSQPDPAATDAEALPAQQQSAPTDQTQTSDTSSLGQPCPPCPCGDGSRDTNSAPIFKNDTNNFPGLPKDTGMIPDSQIPMPTGPDTATPPAPNSIPSDTLR